MLLISDKHTIQTTLGVQSSPSILLCMVLSDKASCVQEYICVEFPVNVTYMVYQMLVCSKKNSSAYFYSDSDDDNSLEYVPL